MPHSLRNKKKTNFVQSRSLCSTFFTANKKIKRMKASNKNNIRNSSLIITAALLKKLHSFIRKKYFKECEQIEIYCRKDFTCNKEIKLKSLESAFDNGQKIDNFFFKNHNYSLHCYSYRNNVIKNNKIINKEKIFRLKRRTTIKNKQLFVMP